MKSNTAHVTQDNAKQQLEKLVENFDVSTPQPFMEAMKGFLTAMDYDDPVLKQSHMNAAFEFMADVANKETQKRLGTPQLVRETWQKTLEMLQGIPGENYDDIGKLIESSLNRVVQNFTSFLDLVILLQKQGYKVELAAQLNRVVDELQGLKDGIVANWPWSDQPLPPVNRKMVAESRAAIARGEGENIKDLIRRLGGEPDKGS